MTKICTLLLIFICAVSLVGCDGGPLYDVQYAKPVVVEPDENTAYTINGYKDITVSDDTASNNESEEVKFIGNKNSKKLHTAICSYVKNLNEENIEIFESLSDAKTRGYSECSRCFK